MRIKTGEDQALPESLFVYTDGLNWEDLSIQSFKSPFNKHETVPLFGDPGREKPGLLIDDVYYDASTFGKITMKRFFFFETGGLERLQQYLDLQHKSLQPPVPAGKRIGSPVARPSKIVYRI